MPWGAPRYRGGGHPPWVLAGSCAAVGVLRGCVWCCGRAAGASAGVGSVARAIVTSWSLSSRLGLAAALRLRQTRADRRGCSVAVYRLNPAAFARAAWSRASASVSARNCAARRVNSSSVASRSGIPQRASTHASTSVRASRAIS